MLCPGAAGGYFFGRVCEGEDATQFRAKQPLLELIGEFVGFGSAECLSGGRPVRVLVVRCVPGFGHSGVDVGDEHRGITSVLARVSKGRGEQFLLALEEIENS